MILLDKIMLGVGTMESIMTWGVILLVIGILIKLYTRKDQRSSLIKFLVFGLIGGRIMMYGYDVLNRQGSIGVVWILVGAAVAYIGVHEDLMEKTKQEMAERERRRE